MRRLGYELTLLDEAGRPLPTSPSGHVRVTPGSQYVIALKNRTEDPARATIAVDGRVVSGQSGILLEAGEALDLIHPVGDRGRFTVFKEGADAVFGTGGGRANPALGLVEVTYQAVKPIAVVSCRTPASAEFDEPAPPARGPTRMRIWSGRDGGSAGQMRPQSLLRSAMRSAPLASPEPASYLADNSAVYGSCAQEGMFIEESGLGGGPPPSAAGGATAEIMYAENLSTQSAVGQKMVANMVMAVASTNFKAAGTGLTDWSRTPSPTPVPSGVQVTGEAVVIALRMVDGDIGKDLAAPDAEAPVNLPFRPEARS